VGEAMREAVRGTVGDTRDGEHQSSEYACRRTHTPLRLAPREGRWLGVSCPHALAGHPTRGVPPGVVRLLRLLAHLMHDSQVPYMLSGASLARLAAHCAAIDPAAAASLFAAPAVGFDLKGGAMGPLVAHSLAPLVGAAACEAVVAECEARARTSWAAGHHTAESSLGVAKSLLGDA
jgi:hypothetical protein